MEAQLDEVKLGEIQSINASVMAEAEASVVSLEVATKQKRFGPESDELLKMVAHHGKEVNRRLDWWLKEFIGPVVNGAYIHWKDLCKRRDMIAGPLEEKKNRAALALGAYKRARDDHQRAEEERINRERLKAEEDARISEALDLHKEGKAEEADEILEEPIHVAPVVLPGAPEVKGTSYRQNWKFRIVDADKIPREFMKPDEVKIGMQVRTSKEKTKIEGIEIYAEEKAGFSTR